MTTRSRTEVEYWTRVERRLLALSAPDESGCRRWTAAHNWRGYGQMKIHNRSTPAHRVAYQVWVGPIPEGLEVDHLCGVRDCIEPSHLEAVTHRENLLRSSNFAARNAASITCPRGHAYTKTNKHGFRLCGECARRRVKCENCGREVSARGLADHRRTDICKLMGGAS